MHLEKVTSRSSEAGLAGWIASNDVTLFTMVLIMVIAMFLHTKLNKGAREQLSLSGENSTLAATLALTQEERDQLQKQLVDKLADLAAVNAKLDALLAEKGELETQRRTLIADKESLTQQRSALVGDRDSLSTANVTLRQRLDLLTAQLADKVAALAEIERQRDRLKIQADELDAIVATLKERLAAMNVELVEARDDAAAQAAVSDEQTEEHLAQLKRAAALLQNLKAEKQQLQTELTEAERLRQTELLEEAQNNRELVGLKGPLRRVAIVVDASGSMRQAGADGGDRWAEAQDIVATWLQHLTVHQGVLIVYSSNVRTFPADGSFADLRGPAGKTQRDVLLAQLKVVKPGGWTNTLDALRKAYEYDVDTVLLFTDGAPSRASSGAYDENIAQQIYQLARQHPNIPINTIGLGNYFDDNMATFLRTIAGLTGGAFRGE